MTTTIQTPMIGIQAHDAEARTLAEAWKYPLRGNQSAPVIVLCEPPTVAAARQSLPMDMDHLRMFAKEALLTGLTEADFLFIGICPPVPKSEEGSAKRKWDFVAQYAEGVREIIAKHNPAFVVTLGAIPSRVMAGRAVKVNSARGRFHPSKGFDIPFFPMLSPTLVSVQPDYRPIFEADMAILKRVKDAGWNPDALTPRQTRYEWCSDLSHLVENPPKLIAIDTETTGLDTSAPDFRVITVQVSVDQGHSYVCRVCPDYFPDHPVFEGQDSATCARLRAQIKALAENPNVEKVLHNGKYDFHALRSMGIEMTNWWDTELMARFVNENFLTYNIDDLIKIYVPEMAGGNDAYNAALDKSQMMTVPPLDETDLSGKVIRPGLLNYAGWDTDATLRLAKALSPRLKADRSNFRVFSRVHRRALYAFGKTMETYGFSVDEDALRAFEQELGAWIENEERELIALVPAAVRRKYLADPKGFSFTRDDCMRDVLFGRWENGKWVKGEGFGLKPKQFTPGTENEPDETKRVPSTSTKTHMPYFLDAPGKAGEFVRRYIELKKAQKIHSTYAKGFWKYIKDGADGERKIIPQFNFRTNTKRTNCVHADTPIKTQRGIVRMADVVVGDFVLTHRGRWRKVTATYCKRDDMMYKVTLSNGQNFLCTLGHMVMTVNGWRSLGDVILEDCRWEPVSGGGGGAPVSGDGSLYEADRGPFENRTGERARDHQAQHPGGRAPEVEGNQIPEQQAGREEPRLREEALEFYRELPGRLRVSNARGGWKTLLRAQDRHGGNAWPTPGTVAEGAGGASHRRGYDEQCTGQSLSGDAIRAHDTASPDGLEVSIVSVEPAGVFPVYDLTVDEDCSYTACGVIHHNSSEPNGQNFPKRGTFAKPFRKVFRASRGKVLVASDLSQAELRIAAWMAQEMVMLDIYRRGLDIHAFTAAMTMGISFDDFLRLDGAIKKQKRQGAKAINFGFIYGAMAPTFRQVAKTDYGVDYTLEEAEAIRSKFFEQYPDLPVWHERTKQFVREHGYVKSLHGLTRHLPAIWSKDWKVSAGAERNAINSPVQNFGSDLGVIAFLRLSAQADPALIRPVGFIHDQLIAEVDEAHVAEGMGWLKWLMENPPLEEWFGITPPLPIVSDPEWGLNLGETTELGDADDEMQAAVAQHVRKPDWWVDDEEAVWAEYEARATVPVHAIREAFFE